MPAVEMGADHNDFLLEVCPGDLSDDVAGFLDRLSDAVADFRFDRDRDAPSDDPVHAVVVLRCHGHDREIGEAFFAGPLVVFCPGPGEAPHGAGKSALTLQDDSHTLGLEKLEFFLGPEKVRVWRRRRFHARRRRNDGLFQLLQFLFRAARDALGQGGQVDCKGGCGQNGAALQLSTVFVQVRLGLDVDDEGPAGDFSRRAGRMGQWEADERLVIRLEHMQRKVFIVPGDAVIHERLDDGVLQTDLLHQAPGPSLGSLHVRGEGQPGA